MSIGVTLREMFLIAPMLALFIASMVPLTIKLINKGKEQPPVASLIQALCGVVVAFILIMSHIHEDSTAIFYRAIMVDGFANAGGVLVLCLTTISLLIGFNNVNVRGHQYSEHLFLLLNSAAGMLILTWANDMMTAFIGIEIMSLAIYSMIAIGHEQLLSKEAAFKYFVLGSFASAILLYGTAMIYGAVGSVYFSDIANVITSIGTNNMLLTIGVTLVVIGFCFKVSIFPFHAWTPDVYQGAPTPITAFMSTGVKAVSFMLFARFVSARAFDTENSFITVMQWLAVLSMLVGNIAAVLQENLKRMLAYSAIAHSGYLLLSIVVLGVDGASGKAEMMFYLYTYAIVNVGAFAIISAFEEQEESEINISDLRGLATERPWLAAILVVLLFSLAGMPPFAGFFAKFMLFSVAVQKGFLWAAIWGVVSSVIAVYFYLKPIVAMYMQKGAGVAEKDLSQQKLSQTAAFAMAVLLIVLGVCSSPLATQLHKMIR